MSVRGKKIILKKKKSSKSHQELRKRCITNFIHIQPQRCKNKMSMRQKEEIRMLLHLKNKCVRSASKSDEGRREKKSYTAMNKACKCGSKEHEYEKCFILEEKKKKKRLSAVIRSLQMPFVGKVESGN